MKRPTKVILMLFCIIIILSGCRFGHQKISPKQENNQKERMLTDTAPKTGESVNIPPAASETESGSSGMMPTRLRILSLKIDAIVEPVHVLENGAMGVPDNFDRVGILVPWTKPGEKGNAVISGHVDHKTGPAVFFHLKRLSPGDIIVVSNDEGRELTFAVKSVETFKTEESPLQRIFGATDAVHLNLVTCTGKFDRTTKEHEKRLVVFTELMEDNAHK